jgi:BASS family bile acid:Na+ symporter
MGIITEIFLPLSLAFIMFSLGLGLTIEDFSRVIKQPKDFLIGLICQIILLPIVAFLIVKIWPISPELAIGVIIISVAPGGVTSNILTFLSKGDVALSISLTAIVSLLSVITVPYVLISSIYLLGYDSLIKDISLLSMAIQMFLIVAIPTLIGMILRKFLTNFAIKFGSIANKISIFLFVFVLIGAIVSEKDNIIEYFAEAGLVTLLLNVLMMILAFYIASFFGSAPPQKKAISIECGLQNGTLAIFIGTTLFNGGAYIIPAATYSIIMFITSLIFIFFVRKVN